MTCLPIIHVLEGGFDMVFTDEGRQFVGDDVIYDHCHLWLEVRTLPLLSKLTGLLLPLFNRRQKFTQVVHEMKKNKVRLSVNINKIATLRNARGGNIPDVQLAAQRCEAFGAQGITVHPRPDERHITYHDVRLLKPLVKTEFNVEGYPNKAFMDLILEVQPHQVTLVPDPPGVLTSNAGWDTIEHAAFLSGVIKELKQAGIRSSIFIETNAELIRAAADIGTDRIELYTESYANAYPHDRVNAVNPFRESAELAHSLGLGVNAGHDLNRENLAYFAAQLPSLEEVSIGHALVSDALYFGLENTIQMYLGELAKA